VGVVTDDKGLSEEIIERVRSLKERTRSASGVDMVDHVCIITWLIR
jgi:hypothetical protein